MIGSLFSGIGGLELGLEAAGFGPVIWQVENDEYCRAVLAKHWPDADRSTIDVRAAQSLQRVHLICGGFPCQGMSGAGKGLGFSDERSGLWFEYHCIVRELRPAYVVVENVASGKRRWLPTVRRMLGALGYRTRAVQLSAADVGAPHRRERVFVLAVADNYGSDIRQQHRRSGWTDRDEATVRRCTGATVDHANRIRQPQCGGDVCECRRRTIDAGQTLGDTQSTGRKQLWGTTEPDRAGQTGEPECGLGGVLAGIPNRLDLPAWWPLGQGDAQDPREPARTIRKGTDPNRCKRLKALGNAVVPQCAYAVGLLLRDWIQELRAQ